MSARYRKERPRAHGLYRPEYERDSCGVGFVEHVKGTASHQIVRDADHLLCRMDHRGARGAELTTGDGAGILTALPREGVARIARDELGTTLPEPGRVGAGVVFLPVDAHERERCKAVVGEICASEGQTLVGWRTVPIEPEKADLGPSALAAAPHIEQVFIAAGEGLEGDAFERKLYLIRKHASHVLRGDASLQEAQTFYVCSLSTKVLIYKGMLTPGQLIEFFPDLQAPDYTTLPHRPQSPTRHPSMPWHSGKNNWWHA
jgi:glutamate synthase (NADPH/NADH) large chain